MNAPIPRSLSKTAWLRQIESRLPTRNTWIYIRSGIRRALFLAGLGLTPIIPLQAAPADSSEFVEGIRAKYALPALAAVVAKDGAICDRVAVGVRKAGDPTPITTNDVFHIGSCTKSMTATLTAMFIEHGKLSWETTITDVFPEFRGKIDKAYENVTVEQLLTHRTGLSGSPPTIAWMRAWDQVGTPTHQRYQFIQAVLKEPPKAPAGSKTIYSNQGYAVVGAMLEKLTGKSWESLITEELFKPLHMNSAGFGPPGTIGKVDQPWGHTRNGSDNEPIQKDNPPSIGPGGTVHCTLDDLARFTILHLGRGNTQQLLRPESIKKLHTPPNGASYACGWVSTPRTWAGGNALTHNGSNTMWYVVMWLAPERDFSVVVGTNVAGPEAEKGCDDVAAAMIRKWLSN
jgi:CubicO group peptidase (beta-lactamase class C family)